MAELSRLTIRRKQGIGNLANLSIWINLLIIVRSSIDLFAASEPIRAYPLPNYSSYPWDSWLTLLRIMRLRRTRVSTIADLQGLLLSSRSLCSVK